MSRPSLAPLVMAGLTLLALGCSRAGAWEAVESPVEEPAQTTVAPVRADASPTAEPSATPRSAGKPVTASTATPPVAPAVGATAPSLTLPDLAGNQVNLHDVQAEAVMLNFWASW